MEILHTMNQRDLTTHAMYSPTDLFYLRTKGYTDEQIWAFWDRDQQRGQKPARHNRKATIAQARGLARFATEKLSAPKVADADLRHALILLKNAATYVELALAERAAASAK